MFGEGTTQTETHACQSVNPGNWGKKTKMQDETCGVPLSSALPSSEEKSATVISARDETDWEKDRKVEKYCKCILK